MGDKKIPKAKLESFLKHLRRAADIAGEYELLMGNGGYIANMLSTIADEAAADYGKDK